MVYKVTIFERYTQRGYLSTWFCFSCYGVQSYNFWKIYTTNCSICPVWFLLLWCTKLQFLKDIHNTCESRSASSLVVMVYKVTIFERYTQQNNKKERKRHFFLHIYIKIYTFAVQFWKIYTIRIIPLCKHSEWHAGVALFFILPYPIHTLCSRVR